MAGVIDGEEPTENSEDSSAATMESDYDYLLSMAIGTQILEKVCKLILDKDKLEHKLEYWRTSSPRTLWLKDLDELEKQLDEQDKADQEAEEQHSHDRAKNGAGKKAGRQASKNTRKPVKKDQAVTEASDISSSSMETENVPAAVVKPKGRGGAKKAKKDASDDDDDFGIPDLRERLAKHTIDSSPDHAADMEAEVAQEPAGKKETRKRATAAKKNPAVSLTEISESISEINIGDEDVEVAAPAKKGGRKPAANSKAAAAAAARKRGQAGKQQQQKLLTQMLKPASVAESSGISPEKKVRKMRASPFNKKSGAALGKANASSLPSMAEIDTDDEDEEVAVVVEPRARPRRANRTKTTYVVSDSETEEDEATEDSDFQEDED